MKKIFISLISILLIIALCFIFNSVYLNCGDGTCSSFESRKTCSIDCKDVLKEYEDRITKGNYSIIFNKKLPKIDAEIILDNDIICINSLKEKLQIEIPEKIKNGFTHYIYLVEKHEKTLANAGDGSINYYLNEDMIQARIEKREENKEKTKQGICMDYHEITHAMIMDTALPLWMNEGFATYTEHKFHTPWKNKDRLAPQCTETGWYIPNYGEKEEIHKYKNLSKTFWLNNDKKIEWYYTGYCFWKYIEEEFGFESVLNILHELKKNKFVTNPIKEIINPALNKDISSELEKRFGLQK